MAGLLLTAGVPLCYLSLSPGLSYRLRGFFLFLFFFSLSVRFIPVFLHQTNRIHSAAAEDMSRI